MNKQVWSLLVRERLLAPWLDAKCLHRLGMCCKAFLGVYNQALSLEMSGVRVPSSILQYPHLEEMTVHTADIPEGRIVEVCQEMERARKLRRLDVTYRYRTRSAERLVATGAPLQTLSITGIRNFVFMDNEVLLKSLPETLEELFLNNICLYWNLEDKVSKMLRLRVLDVSNNPIRDGGAARVAKSLPHLKCLKALYMEDTMMCDEGLAVIGRMLPCSLKELNIASNGFTAEGVRALRLPAGLEQLDISYNDIEDAGLAILSLPPSLQMLDMTEIGAVNGRLVEVVVAKLPSLAELYIGKNFLGDVVLPDHLTHLSLRNTGFTGRYELPRNLRYLDASKNYGIVGKIAHRLPPELRTLVLHDCKIGTEAAMTLWAAMIGSKIESCDVSDNRIRDDHLAEFFA